MTGEETGPGGVGLPARLEADLILLRRVLDERGWSVDPEDEWCWRWPAPQPEGMELFRAGPLIFFDEEDPGLGFLVEPPLMQDAIEPLLRYESVQLLIKVLDRIEAWRYPQQATEIDSAHVVRPGDWSDSGRSPAR